MRAVRESVLPEPIPTRCLAQSHAMVAAGVWELPAARVGWRKPPKAVELLDCWPIRVVWQGEELPE